MVFIQHAVDKKIEKLFVDFIACGSLAEKEALLDKDPDVVDFMKSDNNAAALLATLGHDERLAVKAIAAIGQADIVFRSNDASFDSFRGLIRQLCDINAFYDEIGGIIGYQHTLLTLLSECVDEDDDRVIYHSPDGIDLSYKSDVVAKAVIDGIMALPIMGELYPLGGAGERLGLVDSITHTPLPVAKLRFCGHTLLEGMILDLIAREYLYYKISGERVITPVAIMTSSEKDNDSHIRALCEESQWFGRPKDSFYFFVQPAAPVVTKDGNWSMKAPLMLNLKPGGHGVIWKLAKDKGVFNWMHSKKRSHLLVRQVNNPVAGTDNGIVGLIGVGVSGKKAYGVASCHRLVGSAEGMAVLAEREKNGRYSYGISNVEYTDFMKRGIADAPLEGGGIYSKFPANTNILFVDIKKIEKVVARSPFPGMVVNMKNKGPYYAADGSYKELHSGRLESSMQNIADVLCEEYDHPLRRESWCDLQTFVTYNVRSKTISVTKNRYVPGGKLVETPAGCFYDRMKNMHDLLVHCCGMTVASFPDEETFFIDAPIFMCQMHPIIGPLYDIIAQKIRGGMMAKYAELSLHIAEIEMENVSIDGSLIVKADDVQSGRCTLRDVMIYNNGVDKGGEKDYWNEVKRAESVTIHLRGNGEFIAENVTFSGELFIDVTHGTRVRAYSRDGVVAYETTEIAAPTWSWEYGVAENNRIVLTKKAE